MSQPHFIVTRPSNRATNLVEQLQALSTQDQPLKVSGCPLIDITDYFEEPLTKLSNLNGVIFISGNAVDQARKLLTNVDWHILLKNPLYAIGQQTASVLQSDVNYIAKQSLETRPAQVKFPQQMNSEGLLAMPELKNIEGQDWLIVKGLGGREKLKIELTAAGVKVKELHVYQRKLPDLIAQRQIESYNQSRPYWLVTSIQALNNLWRILKQDPQGCRIIVSSDRIVLEANKKGFKVVAQSKDATDHQLVVCVQQFIIDRNNSATQE